MHLPCPDSACLSEGSEKFAVLIRGTPVKSEPILHHDVVQSWWPHVHVYFVMEQTKVNSESK